MSVDEALEGLKKLASKDASVRQRLLATRDDPKPIGTFCEIATELGFPIYEMDLISAGEDYYAAMRRSTNGGGENSPLLNAEDDYYEMFMEELMSMK